MALDEEDLKKIAGLFDARLAAEREETDARFNKALSGALTARDKKLSTDFKKLVTDTVDGLKSARTDDDSNADGGNAAGQQLANQGQQQQGTQQQAAAAGNDPQFIKLQRQLEQQNKLINELQQANADRDTALRKERADGALRRALEGKVKPEAVDLALDMLKGRGAVQFDDDGNLVLRLMPVATKGVRPVLTDFNVEDGVSELLKTPEGSLLRPAPNAGGSGASTGRRGPAGPIPNRPIEKLNEQEASEAIRDRAGEIQRRMAQADFDGMNG